MNPEWVLNVKRMCEEQGAAFSSSSGVGGVSMVKKEARNTMGAYWMDVPGMQHPGRPRQPYRDARAPVGCAHERVRVMRSTSDA